MSSIDPNRLARRLRRLYPRRVIDAVVASPLLEAGTGFSKYRNDAVGFAYDILGVYLTDDQVRILRKLPGRVKLESGHNVGKSFIMAVILVWWFYTRDPGVVICNSPKLESSKDVLWTEVRLLIARSKVPLPDYFVGPKAPEMYHTPDHWAKAYTTNKGESYQGRHRDNMLFLFDEDEGIEPIYWEATSTMYQPDHGHCWVVACNPLTTSSRSFMESELTNFDGTPKWDIIRLSSLDHPNIVAYKAGLPPPIPNAVSPGQVSDWIRDWTTRLNDPNERYHTDIEWPPQTNNWWRPGPTFKSRVLGIRPTEGVDTVWSVDLWNAAITPKWAPSTCWEQKYGITIGFDASGFGDDDAAFHVRCGPLSLWHESYNGWAPEKAADHIKHLCHVWSAWYNEQAQFDRPKLKPTDVSVLMEFDGGYGIAVHSHRREFSRWNGITVGSASDKYTPDGRPQYANVRAELWFESARKAKIGMMDLSRLSPETKEKLRRQLLAPYFDIKPDGSKLVEPKKEVKEKIGRSPDDADGMIVCYHEKTQSWPTVVMKA